MNKNQIDRSTLQSIKNLDQGDHAKILYRFLTKGDNEGNRREGHIGTFVHGLPTQEKKDFDYIGLMEAIKNNPNFSDTLSAQEAKEFMQPYTPRSASDMLRELLKLFGF